MTPLKGTVISRGTELTIRLSSGARVRVPRQKDLRLGDAVFVCYDYTRMVVREIWTEQEYHTEEDSAGVEWDLVLPPWWDEPADWAVDAEVCPVVSL